MRGVEGLWASFCPPKANRSISKKRDTPIITLYWIPGLRCVLALDRSFRNGVRKGDASHFLICS